MKAMARLDRKTSRTKPKKESKKLNQQSLDEFLDNWSDDDEGEEIVEKRAHSEDQSDDEELGEGKEKGKNQKNTIASSGEKKYLSELQEKDPEFFKFLKENDEDLLRFDDDDDSEDEGKKESDQEKVHRLPDPDSLEVASDESDFEADDEEPAASAPTSRERVSKALLNKWHDQLEAGNVDIKVLSEIADAFRAAVCSVSGATDQDGENKKGKKNAKKGESDGQRAFESQRFVIEGSAMFNSVVRLCVTQLTSAFKKVLNIQEQTEGKEADCATSAKSMQKSKKWRPLNHTLKAYTMDLTRLLAIVGDSTALSALLKHVHTMLPCFVGLQKSSKHLLHRLINLWSTSEDETVRVLAFMSILRLTRSTLATNFETVVKSMYLAYVRNSKFTSPTTWHAIHFMRRSLSELMSLDAKLVYRHAFVYIRQLAINLRNAITVQKKESIQSVYNWQYVHSLHLWSNLLCDSAAKEEALQQLIFPVVQVMVGAIKLVYTSKYFPLRFHICEMMTELSAKTSTFIPVLPFYLDILRSYDFNKRTTKVSMKPVSFSCVLRVSKSQSAENGSKDAIMDCIHRGMFGYLHQQSHKISFPELAIPALAELKEFIKKCKVANYCKKMKQLTEKIEENSKHIVSLRRSAPFGIGNKERIEQWEESVRENGTPLSTFYTSWAEVKRQEDRKKVSEQDSISKHENLPVIKKKAALPKNDEEEEFKGLFGGDQDSDSSEDDMTRFELKEERAKVRAKKRVLKEEKKEEKKESPQKKKKKKAKKVAEKVESEEEDDVVEDFNVDDFSDSE